MSSNVSSVTSRMDTTFEPDQPASCAGLKKSDVIIKVNGQPVKKCSQLHADSKKLKMEVVRKEECFEVKVEPKQFPVPHCDILDLKIAALPLTYCKKHIKRIQ